MNIKNTHWHSSSQDSAHCCNYLVGQEPIALCSFWTHHSRAMIPPANRTPKRTLRFHHTPSWHYFLFTNLKHAHTNHLDHRYIIITQDRINVYVSKTCLCLSIETASRTNMTNASAVSSLNGKN